MNLAPGDYVEAIVCVNRPDPGLFAALMALPTAAAIGASAVWECGPASPLGWLGIIR